MGAVSATVYHACRIFVMFQRDVASRNSKHLSYKKLHSVFDVLQTEIILKFYLLCRGHSSERILNEWIEVADKKRVFNNPYTVGQQYILFAV